MTTDDDDLSEPAGNTKDRPEDAGGNAAGDVADDRRLDRLEALVEYYREQFEDRREDEEFRSDGGWNPWIVASLRTPLDGTHATGHIDSTTSGTYRSGWTAPTTRRTHVPMLVRVLAASWSGGDDE